MRISVDILSDPICPWCYIGKARRDKALEARPEAPLAFVWRPFQLNPDMRREGMDRQVYLERKFGGPAGAARVYGSIEETAHAEGLPVDFTRIRRTPNTLDAHRVIDWAGADDAPEGAQDRLMDRLFAAYFTEGADISDPTVLREAAEAAGLDGDRIAAGLAGDDGLDKIRDQDRAARTAGIEGVPTFIVNGRHVVSGAQPADLWVRVIDELSGAIAEGR